MLEILGDLIAQRVKDATARAQAQAQDRARLAAEARSRGVPQAAPRQPRIVVQRPAAPPAAQPIEEFPTGAVFADPVTAGAPGPHHAARPALLADFSGRGLLGAIVLAEALAKPLALRDEGPRF